MPEEQKDRIMSKVLILMSNSNANINVIAFQIWENMVDNTPKYIIYFMDLLILQMIIIADCSKDEVLEVISAAIRSMLTKYSDRFFTKCLN